MRCFVGLPLPKSYQDRLEDISQTWRSRLKSRISWTRSGNWHLTLFFLGQISQDVASQVQEVLSRIMYPPFRFQAGGGGFFPPGAKKSPRVIWTGLEKGAVDSIALAGQVQAALEQLGFAAEKRPFRPHLTLGRIKQAKVGDDWSALLRDLEAREWPEIRIRSFVLWQSFLKPSGPEYAVVREFPLNGLVQTQEFV